MTPGDWSAIAVSLKVALAAVVCSLPLGVAAGWLLARKRFPGKLILETCVNLPLVMPPVVTGYLLLVAFGRQGPIGSWLDQRLGVQLVFDWKGAALAAAVVSFPLLVRSIRSAIAGVDVRLEDAARTLGAGPWDLFFTITLPLARRGVIAGAVLAFARALGEFGATIMIAGNIAGETRTIPLMIYSQLETPGGERNIVLLIAASILISAAALLVSEYLERRVEPHAP